jgi:hypothetical protein
VSAHAILYLACAIGLVRSDTRLVPVPLHVSWLSEAQETVATSRRERASRGRLSGARAIDDRNEAWIAPDRIEGRRGFEPANTMETGIDGTGSHLQGAVAVSEGSRYARPEVESFRIGERRKIAELPNGSKPGLDVPVDRCRNRVHEKHQMHVADDRSRVERCRSKISCSLPSDCNESIVM